MASAGTVKLTAPQYLALGEDPPGVRLELVDGEIALSPSPTRQHANIILRLSHLLLAHIDTKDLGELSGDIDTIFSPHEVRRPDLLFIRKDRLSLIKAAHGYDIAPDLCVEVLSPGSVEMDRGNKFRLYQASGVPHYWIVDPQQRLFESFELRDGLYRLGVIARDDQTAQAPPFPDLPIPLSRLWPRNT